MEAIIRIIEKNGQNIVSARELHYFLESKQEFSNWIKGRVEKYGLVEGVDFEVYDNFIKNPLGGRPLTEYALTMDAAKEISMVEGNDKGKQARRYFIEVEKSYKANYNRISIPQTLSEALRLAADQADIIEKQAAVLKEQETKVLFSASVEASKQSCLVRDLANVLKQNGVDIGQDRLYKVLRENKYLCTVGESYNRPTQKAMELGLFEVQKGVINHPGREPFVTTTTKVTGKGQVYFVNKFLTNCFA